MVRALIGRRSRRFVAIVAVLFAVAGGIAYATIPNAAGVYTACKLNALGTIRLIDPSLPPTSLLQHCTSLETQISWNQQGQPGAQGPRGANGQAGPAGGTGPAGTNGTDGTSGAPGTNGTNGTDGTNGVSVTAATLSTGDSNCPNGGSSFTAANATTYACNGANGKDGTNGQGGAGLSKLGDLNGLPCTDPNGNASAVTVKVNSDGSVSLACPAVQVQPPTTNEVTLSPATAGVVSIGQFLRTFTLTNTGSNTVSVGPIGWNTTCGASLAAGVSCTITATVTATACDSGTDTIEVTGVDSVSGATYDVVATIVIQTGSNGTPCP